jgi:hypothetical protein
MEHTNFYLYVYLDPRKPGYYKYDDLVFYYEPIYVGKGKNNRKLSHIKECNKDNKGNLLKRNKLSKIKNYISLEEYIDNFILIEFNSINEKFIYSKEEEYVSKIGTIANVWGVDKRGPLTNMLRGGIANPILFGEKNPMFNKTIFDVWKEKEINVEERTKEWKSNIGSSNIGWTKRLSKEKYDLFIENCRIHSSGEYNYFIKLTKEEQNKNIQKRVKSWKNTVEERSEEKQQIINKNISNSLKIYWETISPEQYETWNNNLKRSLDSYWESVKNDPNEQEKIKKRSVKAQETIKNNPEKYKNSVKKRSGQNYYLKKNGAKNLYEYLNEKYGEEVACNYKEDMLKKLSGENNPMYKKGYKISGSKNGRALNIIIHFPDGEKYLCIGTFKKFCKEVLSKIKPQPHRKYPFGKEIDGWYFNKIEDLSSINKNEYILYE